MKHLLAFLLAFFTSGALAEEVEITSSDSAGLVTPKLAITAEETGVIVNDADPQSVAVADYYKLKRNIPEANIIHLNFVVAAAQKARGTLPLNQWNNYVLPTINQKLSSRPDLQQLAITWTNPFRVGSCIGSVGGLTDCLSMTSAIALSLTNYVSGSGANNKLWMYEGYKPLQDKGQRIVSMLAGENVDEVKKLIDKSVTADNTYPTGTGYMIRGTDGIRSGLVGSGDQLVAEWNRPGGVAWVSLKNTLCNSSDCVNKDYLQNAKDVLYVGVGKAQVQYEKTNTYIPGSFCINPTSYGGVLVGTDAVKFGQTSLLRWLEAGCSASIGTVDEPMAYWWWFPYTSYFMKPYFTSRTLGQSMYASVQKMPWTIFVGDPLVRPWGAGTMKVEGEEITFKTTILSPEKKYNLYGCFSAQGPCRKRATFQVPLYQTFEVKARYDRSYYRITTEQLIEQGP